MDLTRNVKVTVHASFTGPEADRLTSVMKKLFNGSDLTPVNQLFTTDEWTFILQLGDRLQTLRSNEV